MISVIIPTHNRPSLLDDALSHIFQQKDVTIEVIVLNDVVSDNLTRKVIEKYPDIIYVEDGSFDGPSSKRKRGFQISQGEYIYTPDDDDYLTDEYFFAKCISMLNSDEALSFVSGNASILYEYEDSSRNAYGEHTLNVQGRISSVDYIQHFQEKYEKPISTAPTLFRRRSFDKEGISNIIEFSDSSIYLICLLYGDAYILEDNVAVYRINAEKSNLTHNASWEYIISVLKQKEYIYLKARLRLPNPKLFLANQFSMTYSFVLQSQWSKMDLIKLNIWLIYHSHLSLKILSKACRNIVNVLIR